MMDVVLQVTDDATLTTTIDVWIYGYHIDTHLLVLLQLQVVVPVLVVVLTSDPIILAT